MCNKIDASHFTSIDEDIAKALAAYCCISIVHVSNVIISTWSCPLSASYTSIILQSLMYRDVLDAHNRVKLANELMMFHMHVSISQEGITFNR